MTSRPLLTSINLWERHERRCLQTLRAAIERLAHGPVDEPEPDLNRRLFRAILAVQADDARSGRESLAVVVPEGRNLPLSSDERRTSREHKIPDFYWAYVDYLAPAPEAAARQFVVECKRLTLATKNWDYLEQYVDAGIRRFVTEEHGYGKETPTGAMIGYLQAVETEAALTAINAHVDIAGLSPLTLREQAGTVVELEHQLDRPFRDSPFLLMHLWTRVAG
jgi:hypothetical protein